jgi:sensor histidine kinase YesM
MITRIVLKFIVIVALISLGMSILVHFNSILESLAIKGGSGHSYRRESPTDVFLEIIITSMVAFCTFILNYYLVKPFNHSKRISFTRIMIAIVLTLVSVFILSDLFFSLKHAVNSVTNPDRFNLLFFFRDLFTATVVLGCVFLIRVINDRQATKLENEKLIRKNLEGQYESLKNQVSPHFLFNSLTALKELISYDRENALLYVSHLSHVLRHTLQSNENQTICLIDEMESVRSYLFLVKMRYDNNLRIGFRIDEKYNTFRLPPLVIQSLIENAIKHNEISKRNPLFIEILTTDKNTLIVTNTIREKLSTEPGTGIGLSNLSKQYGLLNAGDIVISRSEYEFKVELPLLKPSSDVSSNS